MQEIFFEIVQALNGAVFYGCCKTADLIEVLHVSFLPTTPPLISQGEQIMHEKTSRQICFMYSRTFLLFPRLIFILIPHFSISNIPCMLFESYNAILDNSKPKSRTNCEKFSFMSSSENIYCLDFETFC